MDALKESSSCHSHFERLLLTFEDMLDRILRKKYPLLEASLNYWIELSVNYEFLYRQLQVFLGKLAYFTFSHYF